MSIVAHGLRALSAYLKREGHQVRLVFMGGVDRHMPGLYSPEVLARLKELAADAGFIGVSTMAKNVARTVQALEVLRPLGKPLAWGGIFAITRPDYCIRHCDIVCHGEGEFATADLLARLAAGKPIADTPGFWIRQDGQVRENSRCALVCDLNTLPPEDYEQDDHWVLFDGAFIGAAEYFARHHDGRMYISASRGCPFHCAYCCESILKEINRPLGPTLRLREIRSVVDHIVALRERIPSLRRINFTDNDFFARPMADLELLRDELNARVKMPYWLSGSPPSITAERLRCFVDSGLEELDMGIQSGSDRINFGVFGRHMKQERVLQAAEIIGREIAGRQCRHSSQPVRVVYSFITMNPWETNADLLENIKVISHLPVPGHFYQPKLQIFPGTKLYEYAVRDGFVTEEIDPSVTMPTDFNAHWRHKRKWVRYYLTSVQEWLQGAIGAERIGMVPRSLLPRLTSPGAIAFFDGCYPCVRLLNFVLLDMRNIVRNSRESLKRALFAVLGEGRARRWLGRPLPAGK